MNAARSAKNRAEEAQPKAPDTREAASSRDRLPPHDLTAEMAVLGAMMLDSEAAARALEILKDETFFYKDAHKKIFLAAQRLYQRNEPIDIVTLTETLRASKQLDAIGGPIYLSEVNAAVASPANAEHHARIVLRKSMLRKMIHSCTRAIDQCYGEPDDVDSLLDETENEIFHLMEFQRTGGFRKLGTLLTSTFEQLENVQGRHGGALGVRSGFKNLDQITSGFQAGDMIILAGRPSMGKTAFALSIARNAAVEHRVPVGFFSLEMTARQLALRMLCAEARVDSVLLRTGKLEPKKFQKLPIVIGKLAGAPIYIDDSAALSAMELRARARRLKAEFNIGLIIVDYLGLMEIPYKKFDNQQQKVAEISRSLKALAKDLDTPIIVLSQLSRAVETRQGDKRPILSDLRDSGAIEQDADVVMFIYRPGVYRQHGDEDKLANLRTTEINIAKQRNGPLGTANLSFDYTTGYFEEAAPGYLQEMEESAGEHTPY